MATVVRFADTVRSENDELYIFGIWDEDYLGGTSEQITVRSIEISYQAEDKNRFAPILGAYATIEILVNKSSVETLIDDIVGAEEGRFAVRIFRSLELMFVGYIMSDLISIENSKTQVGYVFTITATDSLARLKTIEYSNNGVAYEGYETIMKHIFNALLKLEGITQLYTGALVNQYYVNVVCNWFENSISYSTSTNPLTLARVHHRAFYEKDTKGNTIFLSCYEVLERICLAFGMRCLYSLGSFWFIQVGEYSENTVSLFQYETDETENVELAFPINVTHSQSTLSSTDLIEMSGGEYRFYSPLLKTLVKYNHTSTINLLGGEVWTSVTQPTVTYEDIASNSGLGKLSYKGILQYNWISGNPTLYPAYMVFEFTIQVGTYYLVRTVTFAGGSFTYDDNEGEWTTSPGVFQFVIQPAITSDNSSFTTTIQFVSPALQEDGDLSFTVDYGTTYEADGTTAPTPNLTWNLDNNYLEILYIGTFSGQNDIFEYTASNDASANSEEVVVETFLGSGPTITSPGHVEVSGASAWSSAMDWRRGNSGDYKRMGQLLANEIIKSRLTPVRKKLCVFHEKDGEYHPHLAIKDTDNNRLYVPQQLTFILGSDDISGEWFMISPAALTFTEEEITELPNPAYTDKSSATGSGGEVVPSNIKGTGTITQIFKEEFTSVSSDQVTITVNGGTLPDNYDFIFVFWNGQWTNQYSIAGSVITFNMTIYSDDYINVIFFI